MEYSIDFVGGIVVCVAQGHANVATVGEMLSAALDHDEWNEGDPFLFDYTALDTSKLSTEDVRILADLGTPRASEIGKGKAAVVVNRDLEFGLVRMFQVFVEDKVETTFKVFRSKEEALDWLASE